MNRAHNFNAGPAILPVPVLEATQKAVIDYNGLGMSVMEMSHRSKEIVALFDETSADCLKIMNLSADDYTVLYLGGGASMQFAMIPYNFLHTSADYVNTGEWATKAIKEAKLIGNVNVVASSEESKFNYIPKNLTFDPNADYVHITTNNTIYGTRWNEIPEVGNVPLIVDMSSEMFSRQLDYSKFSLIYAGAQKNIGPSGVTLVIIKKSFLETAKNTGLTMLKYSTHTKADSMFNTPPVIPVYVMNQTFKWILNQGGLEAVEAVNNKKAGILYSCIDSHPDFYKGSVINKEDRSLMNVTWNLPTPELENQFIKEAEKLNMIGLKGHRSVGGVRASIYNACPIESIQALVDFMEQFYQANK